MKITHAPTVSKVETVRFALDGEAFEIDLPEPDAAGLRRIFRPYIEHGRRRGTVPRAPARFRVVSGAEARAAGEWALAQGMNVSLKGRVPAGVIDRYHAARCWRCSPV